MHLPTELWHSIFSDIDLYYLRTVSLTCREFRSIARPFIFRSLSLCTGNPGQLEERDSARLEFYASDVIAPFVRKFTLSNLSPARISPPDFDRLRRFINLRVLSFVGLNFTRISFQQIATFPSLKFVCFTDCTPPPDTDLLPLLRTHTFRYQHSWRHGEDLEFVRVDRWIALLNGDRLAALDVPLTQGVCSYILAIDNPHPFPSLHTIILRAGPDQGTFSQVPTILSKTPTVRSTTSLVPYLEVYDGPHELLRIIRGRGTESPSAPLRKLYLQSITENTEPLTVYMDTLVSCHPHLRDITHLHIRMLKSIELDSLVVLKDVCPLLQELCIYAYTLTQDDALLDSLYTLPLPSTLTSVSIQWTLRQRLANFFAAKDNLVNRLPSLRRLWLCDSSQVALVWHRTSSGTEHCTVRVVALRAPRSDFWKIRLVAFPEDPRVLRRFGW